MIAAVGLLLAWALLLAMPDTSVGHALYRLLVEWPARRLPLFTRGHLALALLLLIVAVTMIWLLEADGMRLLAMASPEIATWATMFEVSTLLDAGIAVMVAAGSLRLRGLGTAIALRLRGGRRPRSRRSRARPRPCANDEEGPAPMAGRTPVSIHHHVSAQAA